MYRHIDSARYYRNEDQVGRAVRESGVSREEVFVSAYFPSEKRAKALLTKLALVLATKIYDPHHGYDSTIKAVDESLQRFGFGGCIVECSPDSVLTRADGRLH